MFNTIKVNNTDTNYTHSIFDISDYNSGSTYTDLSAALAAIPESKLHGGMSIKFVTPDTPARYSVVKTENLETEPTGTLLSEAPAIDSGTYDESQLSGIFTTLPSSTGAGNALTYYVAVTVDETTTYTSWVITKVLNNENNYIQYRYMGTAVDGTPNPFLDTANWQGIDIKPIHASKNTIESGSVADAIYNYESKTLSSKSKLFFTDVAPTIASSISTASCKYFPCSAGDMFCILASYSSGGNNLKLYIGTTTEVPAAGVAVNNIVSFDGKDVDTAYTASGNGYIVIAVYSVNWSDVQLKLVTSKFDALKDEIEADINEELLYIGSEVTLGAVTEIADKMYDNDVTSSYITSWTDGYWDVNGIFQDNSGFSTSNRFQLPRGGYLFDFCTNARLVSCVRISDAENNTVRLFNAAVFNVAGGASLIYKFLYSSMNSDLYIELSRDKRYTSYPKIYKITDDDFVKLSNYNNYKQATDSQISNIQEELKVQVGYTDIPMTTGAYIDSNGAINEAATRYHISNKINVNVGDRFQYALVSFNSSIITLYDANDNVLEVNMNNHDYVTGVYVVENPLASYMYFGYQDGYVTDPIYVHKLSCESIKDFVVNARPMYGKVIYLFGDSISSTNYPWYKEYLEKYTGATVFPMGDPGRNTGYLAKNTNFDKLATIDFDVCVALTGANDTGAQGSVGTFSADSELYSMGEPIVDEPSIDVTDYDDTDKKLIQSISYIIRKWKKLYWNFRLKANLNACILDGDNNFEVVYPLSGTATEQECITYAAEHDMGNIGYFQGRYFLRTTETPESKRQKLMSVKHPKLYYCTTFPRRINSPSDWHSSLEMAERKRLAVIECCKKYGIPCIDLAKEWDIQWSEEPCNYNPDNRPLSQLILDNEGIYTMDGVHPNEFGYEWIARIVAKALNA